MAYPRNNSWAILPATQALFGRTKVTLEAVMLERGGGTILICERKNGDGKTTRFFLSSSGIMDCYKPGTQHDAHHDQNFRSYGSIKILAVLFYDVAKGVDGKDQVVTTLPMGVNLSMNYPLFVFK
jgi:hypothetical protein